VNSVFSVVKFKPVRKMSKPIIEVKGISKRYQLVSIGAQTMRDEVEAFFARFKKTSRSTLSNFKV
jgi:hypothetical protein